MIGQGGSKVIVAPKLQNSLLKSNGGGGGGLGSSAAGIGSSSILNLPVLAGQDSVLLPTNRGMKGVESSKQLFRQEESKISGVALSPGSEYLAGKASVPLQQAQKAPSYYSRGTNGSSDPLSPSSTKDPLLAQSSRNMSVLNIKKSSARFLSPIGAGGGGHESAAPGMIGPLGPPSI